MQMFHNVSFIILLFSSCILGKDIIPLFYKGIKVKHQRVTGPQFIVLSGQEILCKTCPCDDINCKEISIDKEVDTDHGPLYSGTTCILHGDYLQYESVGNEKYAVVKVVSIFPMLGYRIRQILFGLSSILATYFLFKLSRKII